MEKIKKKCAFVIMILLSLALGNTISADYTDGLYIEDYDSSPGVSLPIDVKIGSITQEDNFDAFGFVLFYDASKIKYINFQKGSLLSSASTDPENTQGLILGLLDVNEIEPGKLKIGGLSVNKIISANGGSLISLNFEIFQGSAGIVHLSLTDTEDGLSSKQIRNGKIDLIVSSEICTDLDWENYIIPEECPESGIKNNVWVKTSDNCTGGVIHKDITEVSCDYVPECSHDNWSYSIAECSESGSQVELWTKLGTCENGITHSEDENILTCTYGDRMYGDFVGDGGGLISLDDLLDAQDELDNSLIIKTQADEQITFDDVLYLYKHIQNPEQYPIVAGDGDYVGIGGALISEDDIVDDPTLALKVQSDGSITFDDVIRLFKNIDESWAYPLN